MHFDIIVLGAGINGLSTAYHLAKRKAGTIAVLEQFTPGHGQGSSHGMSRITRSTYSSVRYVELIQQAHNEEWPRLEAEAGRRFLNSTPGCFFGPGIAPYLESVQAVPDLLERVRILDPTEGRKAFPAFSFPDSNTIIEDLTCSVVAANDTITWLACSVSESCTVIDGCRVQSLERDDAEIRLRTSRGDYTCGRLAVTAGAWLPGLLPELAPKLKVAHQDVGYYQVEGAQEFPVWVYCPEEGESHYGLPQFGGRPGVKVARHRTCGKDGSGDDPDRTLVEEMPSEARESLDAFVAEQFAKPARQVGYEACLYTNTVSEDFLLDHFPGDKRIVIGSACSGHGFKFGPLTGRILSELLIDGATSVPAFEKHREAFLISAQSAWI